MNRKDHMAETPVQRTSKEQKMTKFVRKKRFQREFIRVCLGEQDLAFLARRISNAMETELGEITIEVETTDDQDSFESHDPAFFTSDDMPTNIKNVAISYSHHCAPITCELSNHNPFSLRKVRGSLMLSVEGTGHGVEQLFRDLERDLAARQVFGQWLLLAKDKFWAMFLVGMFSAAAVYSVFDIVLDLWAQLHLEFRMSTGHLVMSGIGLAVVFFSLFGGPVWFKGAIEKHLPPVEFTGRFTGRKTLDRRMFFWVAILFLVPIFVNIFSELLLDIVRFWLIAS